MLPTEEIIRRVGERATTIHTMEAEGALTVETTEQAGTLGFELQMKLPDTLWMKFSGPFGIAVGTLLLTPREFVFYSPHERQKIMGEPRRDILSRVLNVSLSYADIVSILQGNFNRLDGDDSITSTTIAENQYYVLQANGNASRKELWVDGSAFLTTRFTEYDREDRLMVVGQAGRIETVDSMTMPHLIRLILPQQRQSVTVAYSTVRINHTQEKTFSIPVGVEELFIHGVQ